MASVQILIVNIIMDSLNSLSFGGEPPKAEYMEESPIKKGSGLFIRGAKSRIAISAITFMALFGVITFGPVGKMFTTDIQAMTARFALYVSWPYLTDSVLEQNILISSMDFRKINYS